VLTSRVLSAGAKQWRGAGESWLPRIAPQSTSCSASSCSASSSLLGARVVVRRLQARPAAIARLWSCAACSLCMCGGCSMLSLSRFVSDVCFDRLCVFRLAVAFGCFCTIGSAVGCVWLFFLSVALAFGCFALCPRRCRGAYRRFYRYRAHKASKHWVLVLADPLRVPEERNP
jgi:hypothetical protein